MGTVEIVVLFETVRAHFSVRCVLLWCSIEHWEDQEFTGFYRITTTGHTLRNTRKQFIIYNETHPSQPSPPESANFFLCLLSAAFLRIISVCGYALSVWAVYFLMSVWTHSCSPATIRDTSRSRLLQNGHVYIYILCGLLLCYFVTPIDGFHDLSRSALVTIFGGSHASVIQSNRKLVLKR